MNKTPSPCLTCTRVKDPRNCENKNCQIWQRWFIRRWEAIRACARSQMEQMPQPVGVTVSGRVYAAPHQVKKYLQTDPCNGCLCPKNLCAVPCRLKSHWQKAREDVLL